MLTKIQKHMLKIIVVALGLGLFLMLNIPSILATSEFNQLPTDIQPQPTQAPFPTPIIDVPRAPNPSTEELPPYIPFEDLPWCDDGTKIIVISPEMAQPPTEADMNKPSACRMHSLTAGNDAPGTTFPLPKRMERGGKPVESVDEGTVSSSAVSAASYAWSGFFVDCSGCAASDPKFDAMYFVASAVDTWLTWPNWGWNSYAASFRGHLSPLGSPFACNYHGETISSIQENVSIGHTKGRIPGGSAVTGNYMVFWEEFDSSPNKCEFHPTIYTISPTSAIYYGIYISNVGGARHYIGRVYYNNQWNALFDVVLNGDALDYDLAGELAATFGDLGTIVVPMSIIDKVRIKLTGSSIHYPLYRAVLPSYLQPTYVLGDVKNSPWITIDSVPWDYTALGIKANN